MRSHENFAQFMERAHADMFDWPNSPEKLDEYLLSCGSAELGLEGHESRVSTVMTLVEDTRAAAKPAQKQLWNFSDGTKASDEKCSLDIHSVVKEAYLEMYDGFSTDRVVADPDKNSMFIQACWSRGIQASQCQLNKLLLNARKSKKLGKIEGVKAYRIPRHVMDQYELASEVAVRLLQEREHYTNQRWVSLDDILCDPKLGKQFFELANSITPGFKAVDYRWAALSVRKAINRRHFPDDTLEYPHFDAIGARDQIRASKIPREAGFFWMKSQGVNFYVGHSGNLRAQIEMLLDEEIEETLACYNTYSLFDSGPLTYSIAPLPSLSVSARNPIKRLLVAEFEPRLNIAKQGDRAVP